MKIILTHVIAISFFLIIGCSGESNDSQPTNSIAIQQYTFHYISAPTSTVIALPQQLDDANWSLKEYTCEQVGYSLLPYAGQNVTAIKYSITETYSSEPLYLWVIEQDQTTICGYLTAREGGSIPGVFALNDPNVN